MHPFTDILFQYTTFCLVWSRTDIWAFLERVWRQSHRQTLSRNTDVLFDSIMLFNVFIWIAGNPARADQSALGAINRPLRMSGLARADQSAMGAINRPLRMT